ncbi:tRNA (guanosine(37)-N1)-methyltransferase TrmD [bacterium]|nr:tRNA (guanosine(37)-N1)-methyltransferase TrmD [bacterium]
MIRFDVITAFPELITSYCNESIIARAQKADKIKIFAHNLRNWTTDRHKVIDDKVFGGGPGMLLKVEPLFKAITELKQKAISDGFIPKVYISVASGNLFTQQKAGQIAHADENRAYIILCGHYEGFDARIMEFVDETLTVGPYVLTGGELASLIMIDAVTRLLPGVLGNESSANLETTFTLSNGKILVDEEYPQYTTPAVFTFTDEQGVEQTRRVPDILRSGHHKKIQEENNSQRVKKVLVTE